MLKKLILIITVITCLIGTVMVCRAQSPEQPAGTPGGQAIDFTLKDLSGKEVNLMKDFAKRKAVILVFSATWCPYCVQEIPALKAIYSKYNVKGVEIIHIDPQEGRDRVQRLVSKYKIPYPVLLDESGSVTREYKVMGLPTVIILDQKRNIRWRSSGGEQDYEGRLQELGIK